MILCILETLSANDSKFVESALLSVGRDEDYIIEKCSKDRLHLLDTGGRPRVCIGGELQGIIFYEE